MFLLLIRIRLLFLILSYIWWILKCFITFNFDFMFLRKRTFLACPDCLARNCHSLLIVLVCFFCLHITATITDMRVIISILMSQRGITIDLTILRLVYLYLNVRAVEVFLFHFFDDWFHPSLIKVPKCVELRVGYSISWIVRIVYSHTLIFLIIFIISD